TVGMEALPRLVGERVLQVFDRDDAAPPGLLLPTSQRVKAIVRGRQRDHGVRESRRVLVKDAVGLALAATPDPTAAWIRRVRVDPRERERAHVQPTRVTIATTQHRRSRSE